MNGAHECGWVSSPLSGRKIQSHNCVWGKGLLCVSRARRCPVKICGVTNYCIEIASPTLLHSVHDNKFEGVGRGNHGAFQLITIKSEHIKTAGVLWLRMHQLTLNHLVLLSFCSFTEEIETSTCPSHLLTSLLWAALLSYSNTNAWNCLSYKKIT